MQNPQLSFRFPGRAALRLSAGFFFLGVLGMALETAFVGRSKFDDKVLFLVAGALFVVSLAIYASLRLRTWVTVMPEGVRGRFLFLFWKTVPWTSLGCPFSKPTWFIRGYQIGRCDEMGTPLPFTTVFVPAAIFHSPQFAQAVRAFAPQGCVLLKGARHAI